MSDREKPEKRYCGLCGDDREIVHWGFIHYEERESQEPATLVRCGGESWEGENRSRRRKQRKSVAESDEILMVQRQILCSGTNFFRYDVKLRRSTVGFFADVLGNLVVSLS